MTKLAVLEENLRQTLPGRVELELCLLLAKHLYQDVQNAAARLSRGPE